MFSYTFDTVITTTQQEPSLPTVLALPGELTSPYIGIELEYEHSPHALFMRDVLACLAHDGIVDDKYFFTDKTGNKVHGAHGLHIAALEYIFPKYEQYFFKPAHVDEGVSKNCLEFSFKPMTMKWLLENKAIMSEILLKAKDMGYLNTPECGMHVWLDYTILGSHVEEIKTTLENFLWFALREERFIHLELCNRVGVSSTLSDMKCLLGDSYGMMSQDAFVEVFKREKKNLLRILTDNGLKTQTTVFNITFSKKGTQTLEFRWFASSLNTEDIIKKVSLLLDIFLFCKQLGKDNEHMISLYEFNKYLGTSKNFSNRRNKMFA